MGFIAPFIAAAAPYLAVASAATSIIGGIQANKEAKRQAAIAREDAALQAANERSEADQHAQRQKSMLIKSGVRIGAGSPLLLLQETYETGEKNAETMIREGNNRARTLKSQGREALFQGFGNAFKSGASAYDAFSQKVPAPKTTPTTNRLSPTQQKVSNLLFPD